MESSVVIFLLRSKWCLVIVLLLSWLCPALYGMNADSLCKSPLCECGTAQTADGNLSVVAVICRGAGLREVPKNIQQFNETLRVL